MIQDVGMPVIGFSAAAISSAYGMKKMLAISDRAYLRYFSDFDEFSEQNRNEIAQDFNDN